MKLINRKVLCFIYLFSSFLGAQELPPIQNYSPDEYAAGNQNWGITQSKDRIIYVANNKGLLEFNGANWQLHESPNETIMRSVKVIKDRIYTGCYMEFGFWKKNPLGKLEYTSISQGLDIDLVEDEEFWDINGIDDWVVFQSLKRLYIYNVKKASVDIIESDQVIIKMFNVNNAFYFQRNNEGIYKIINGVDTLLFGDKVFKEDEVINIIPDKENLIIITKHNGIFISKEGTIQQGKSNKNLEGVSIYSARQLSNKQIVLGTISNGLIHLDENLEVIQVINRSNGLLNNTILSIFEDLDGNIWLGLDNGISYININAPIDIFEDKNGTLGSVYASAIYENSLYLGTNQGLFIKSLEGDQDFEFVSGTEGQVWSLSIIDNTLFCGHHNGTFTVSSNVATQVADIQGTWKISKLSDNPDLLLQGNYDGLYILKYQNNSWRIRNKINGFDNSARHFDVLYDQIFVNHEYQGVFMLTVDKDLLGVNKIKVDTLLKGANSSVTKYKGDILYAFKKGIFSYNPSQQKFIKDSVLSNIYSEENYISGKLLLNQQNDEFWVFTKNNITLVSAGNFANEPKITSIPLSLGVRGDVEEYENIINFDDPNKYLLGTSSGYITIDLDHFITNSFSIYLNEISLGLNADYSGSGIFINKDENGRFDSDENDIKFSFFAPVFIKYLRPSYQFQLDGIYDSWSEWTNEPEVLFENLPPGNYTFNVRAKVGEKISDNIASYSFEILKPWYITNLMLIVYLIGVILFSIMMHNVYKIYYRRQEEKLIEENRKELELARLQSEKEIIRIKNEQLEKDYKSKSNELAASTMSIIKKNEVLNQIKEELAKVNDKDVVKPVIKTIDKNLNQQKNWELFQEAFNSADQDFFKKMKEIHPDLSPNDLKLCAYMRLNLSSKEVSQLINISPRSVEVKRYRLRKKLNLSSNENLSDYIMSI